MPSPRTLTHIRSMSRPKLSLRGLRTNYTESEPGIAAVTPTGLKSSLTSRPTCNIAPPHCLTLPSLGERWGLGQGRERAGVRATLLRLRFARRGGGGTAHRRGGCAGALIPWVVQRGEGCRVGHAGTLSPPIARGWARTARAPSAWPPVRTLPLQGKGCEYNPTRRHTCTRLAHPTIWKPPCTRRPTCGTACAWHPNGGVCKARARATARGVVLTHNGGGAASLWRLPPALRVTLGLCTAP